MTNRFTEDAKKVICDAVETAREFGHTYVGSEHLLLAVVKTSPKCFADTPITYTRIREQICDLAGVDMIMSKGGEDMTPKCKKILIVASKKASADNCNEISANCNSKLQ